MSKTSRAAWCHSLCLFAVIACTGLAADLLTKHWAFQKVGMPGEYMITEPQGVYWVWQDVLGIQTSLNTGALFGFGAGQITFLVTLSLIFLTGIIGYILFWGWQSRFLSTILGMITAGICGNLYDRLGWHGLIWPDWHPLAGQQAYAVRDWILCMIGTFHWPNFNIADSLLVCSVLLLLLHEFLFNKTPPTTESTAQNSTAQTPTTQDSAVRELTPQESTTQKGA